jgi:proteic killer suppression protein
MIRSFRHRGLERFFRKGSPKGIPVERAAKIERLLDRLDAAKQPQDMNLPGFDWHPLKGNRKGAYAVSVSGNWRITYRFEGEHAEDVNLEDYH